jgi:hypothetical protein
VKERAAAYARLKEEDHEPRHRHDQVGHGGGRGGISDLMLTDAAVGMLRWMKLWLGVAELLRAWVLGLQASHGLVCTAARRRS